MLYIFFKAQIQHDISLVKHSKSQTAKIKVASFHVIFDTAGRSHKNINASAKLIHLAVDVHTAIDSEHRVLSWIVFQEFKLLGDLEG